MILPERLLLHEYISYWADQYSERTAVWDGETIFTYRDLDEQSNRLAQGLQMLGFGKEGYVVTVLPPSFEYILLLIAASKLGAIIVPFDVRYRDQDFLRFLGLIDTGLVVTIPSVEDYPVADMLKTHLDESTMLISTEEYADLQTFSTLLSDDANPIEQAVGVDDPLLLIFTGGTTAYPKGALIAHSQIVGTSKLEYETILGYTRYDVDQGAAMLAALPPSHIGGSVEIIAGSLIAGLTLVCQPSWHPVEVLKATAQYRMPAITGVPAMFHLLLSLPLDQFDLTMIEIAVLSGDKVSSSLISEIRTRLCSQVVVSYGMTEANVLTLSDPDDPTQLFDQGYVGKPLADVDIKTDINIDMTNNSQQRIGELLVQGSSMIQGYYHLPEETAASFSQGYFRTGDLGWLDSHNRLFIEGRIKDIIRVGSYTVLSSEIENFVGEQPGIVMATAIGIPDKILGEAVCLIVVLEPNSVHTSESLTELCVNHLADYKVPRSVFIRGELPLTRVGKVDKRQLVKDILPHIPSVSN